jgi:cyclopropane fatty-acyl-phospholipid synthase-like methyltransferase
MSIGYRLMYAAGLTPWDDETPPPELVGLVQGDQALPPARALDLGCGTGTDAVFLAQRGWQVTGVDSVARPLQAARRRAQEAGVEVAWVQGSVAALDTLGLAGPFHLVQDVGCFHGLSDDQRNGYVRAVTALSATSATMLLFAFLPGRRGPAPRGVSREELQERFGPQWELVEWHRDEHAELKGPLRNAAPHWYRFQRL